MLGGKMKIKTVVALTVALLTVFSMAFQNDVIAWGQWGPKWQNYQLPLPMEMNQSGTPDCSGVTEFGAAKRAGVTWNRTACSYFSFAVGPGHPNNRGAPISDGVNNVIWDYGTGALAVTWAWWSGSTRYECDTILDEGYKWSCSGSPGYNEYDAETVVLHEIGHTLALDHTGYSAAVMYPYYSGVRRSLHWDDEDGICGIYPAGALTKKDIELKVQLMDGFDDF
jgi:hypothetical protein